MPFAFDYFYGNEAEQFTFYRVPKLLITSPAFKQVSDSAKLLYGLMLDRMGLSLKNGWVDENNRAYIYFTTKDVMEQMCCGTEKATKLLAELDGEKGIGLIERKKQGQGKPTIIFLKKFAVVSNENEQTSRLSISESQDFCQPNPQTFENRKTRLLVSKSADFRQTKCNDMNNNHTEYSDTKLVSHPIRQPTDEIRWKAERQQYERLIRQNINYDTIVNDYGATWLDEIVTLMVDVVCSREKTIRISKQDYPQEVVKSRFLKINASHMEYIYFALHENTSNVRNIRAFLITTIYRAFETADNWYLAKVNHDMAQGGC